MNGNCTALVVLAFAAGLGAEDKPADLPKPDADGFITIFNGKDLTGWEGLEDFWSVKDGVISGHETKDKSKQTFLVWTAVKPGDFELHLKYKFATPDGNSGIQFRSKVLDPKTFRVGGYQADFDGKGGYDGSIYDEAGVAGGRGTMSNRGEKTIWDADNKRHNEKLAGSGDDLKKFIKVGDWNDVVLVAKGNHITYSINGHLMTDLTDDSPKALKEGVIALQLHAGFTMDIQFKDVKIKLLEPTKCADGGLPVSRNAQRTIRTASPLRVAANRIDFLKKAPDFKRLLADKPCPHDRHGAPAASTAASGTAARTSGMTLLRQAIVGGFDWVDLETDIADSIRRFGSVQRIVSYHNFREMPADLEKIHQRHVQPGRRRGQDRRHRPAARRQPARAGAASASRPADRGLLHGRPGLSQPDPAGQVRRAVHLRGLQQGTQHRSGHAVVR